MLCGGCGFVVVEGLGLCEAKKKGSRARKERGAGLPACGWRLEEGAGVAALGLIS